MLFSRAPGAGRSIRPDGASVEGAELDPFKAGAGSPTPSAKPSNDLNFQHF
jgi:hypothetical protein